jgi:hypothetical protein
MSNTFKHTLLQKKLYDCLYHFLYSSLEETHLRHFINLKKIGSDSLSQWYEMFLRCYPEKVYKDKVVNNYTYKHKLKEILSLMGY